MKLKLQFYIPIQFKFRLCWHRSQPILLFDPKMKWASAVEEVMAADAPAAEPQNSSSSQDSGSGWSLDSIRDGFQTVNGYFDSVVEMMGGYNGVCQYRCQYDKTPLPRGDYKVPEPSGCSSFLLGLQVAETLDMGVPAMTKCCSQLEVCYNTCGSNKYRCDSKFRLCLHGICSDLRRSLGFVSKVEACESMADGLFNTVWTLGCRPYMNSQRAACFCEGEEKDEL
uniref:Phospholipase A2, group XIIB n=1 Tax=Denticeps clupeoides TaxID=299321 RepID=A0AAY4DYZ4_9TELE